jgi:hypothetical protein
LDLWRKELAAGTRTKWTFDVVWEAACLESAALEFQAIPQLSDAFRSDAKRIILNAAKRQKAV